MSETSGSVCVFGVNGECMVRGVIGGSKSRPRVPGVKFKVELVVSQIDKMEVVLLLVGK